MVHVPVIEREVLGVCLTGCQRANCCATGGAFLVLACSVYFSECACLVKAHVRCKKHCDIAICRAMTTESAPASLPGEGQAGQPSQVEKFAPASCEQMRDVVFLIMISLIWARTLCEKSVFRRES